MSVAAPYATLALSLPRHTDCHQHGTYCRCLNLYGLPKSNLSGEQHLLSWGGKTLP
jgi:hypothetical protein